MSKLYDQGKLVLSKSKLAMINSNVDDLIQQIDLDNEMHGEFEEVIITHLDVFNGLGSMSMENYVKACEFVTYYYADNNQSEAWKRTFPDRLAKLKKKDDATVSSYASTYFRGGLVQKILRQSAVSLGVFYSGYSHKAVQKLYNLMESSNSDRIQMESADKLLGHLKEVGSKSQLDLNVNVTHKTDFIGDLQDAMGQMLNKQKAAIEAGMDLKTVANARIGSEPEIIDVLVEGN